VAFPLKHVGLNKAGPHLDIQSPERLGICLQAESLVKPVLDIGGAMELQLVEQTRQPADFFVCVHCEVHMEGESAA
jgi:hypothetical protein